MDELKRLIRPGSGSEARTARSMYGLRLVLSLVAFPLAIIAAIWFLLNADDGPWNSTGMVVVGVICAAVAFVAAVDIVVIRRRRGKG